MTRNEFLKKFSEIEDRANVDKEDLCKKYGSEEGAYKVTDIIEANDVRISIASVNWNPAHLVSTFPRFTYLGIELDRYNEPVNQPPNFVEIYQGRDVKLIRRGN
jgi:hypothetical protein